MRDPNPKELLRLKRWRTSTFWVMLLGYVGYYLCRGNLSVALPLLSENFHYTNSELGIILTFSEIAYALGKFTNGPIADRIGGKKIFLLGLWGAVVFNLLFPLHVSLLYFTVIWCICRWFLSMGWGGIVKTIGEWYEPEKNGTIMGIISINFQFGSGLAAVFCGGLIAWGAGWKGLFFYPAIVVSVMGIWATFASKSNPGEVIAGVKFGKSAGKKKAIAEFKSQKSAAHDALHIVQTLLAIPLFRQVLVFGFLSTLLRSIFMFWIPKFLVDIGMKSFTAAMTSAVFPLLGCLGTLFMGWYTDRHSKNGDRARMMWMMLSGLTVSLLAIAMLIPMGLRHDQWIIALLGLSGFFLYGPYSMSAGALSLDIAGPAGAGTASGLIDGIGYFGGALAAWGAGYLADKMGWKEVYLVLTGVSLISVAWTYYMSVAHQRNFKRKQVRA